jgi:hypothetical protein
MLNDRENILSALREKPLKVYEVMKRANVVNEEACQSLLLKMRDEGLVKFDIHKGRWLIGWFAKLRVTVQRWSQKTRCAFLPSEADTRRSNVGDVDIFLSALGG